MKRWQKIQTAKDFVSMHKDSDIDNWLPYNTVMLGDEKYLYIYNNMINNVYGECRHVDGELEIEISQHSSKNGKPILFTW